MTWLIIIGGFIVLLTLLNLKTSRSDGVLLGDIHPYRKVMMHIMPTRNESYVLYEDFVVATSSCVTSATSTAASNATCSTLSSRASRTACARPRR